MTIHHFGPRRLWLAILSAVAVGAFSQPYRDARLSVDERVADLLGRMTVEEKLAQLQCPLGWTYDEQSDTVGVGMLWATFRADPWTGRTLTNGFRPCTAAHRANELQRHAVEGTRLGIPLLLAEEAPHGHMAIGTTTFPTGLGLGATFSPQLIERVGQTIGREISRQGGHIAFGPVLDLGRDPRWSRTEETMGEDTYLVGTLGSAMVRGMGNVTATLKHFAAYGMGQGGQNGASVALGRNELLRDYLPPFRRAVEAGALGVMTAYGALDGQPCTGNPWLLRELLRDEWGFRGLVISDLYSINVLHNTLHATATLEEAARLALQAGVDVDLGASAYEKLKRKDESVKIAPSALDEAVRRVLRLKFAMGLFEHPYVDEALTDEVHTEADIQLARDVSRASITLLKNDGLLPLVPGTKIALVGPQADNVYALLGDYTAPQPEGKVVTLRQGLRAKGFRLVSVPNADVVVAAVGGSSSRYEGLEYQETGAAQSSIFSSFGSSIADSGEGLDRSTLDLPGSQQALLDSLKQMGKPLVVVYIEGRPLLKNWAAAHADALLTAYYPGEQGGTALADVLSGDYNPAGRLPVSVPRSVGQLPVYYSRPLPQAHDYLEGPATPLYPFGYGLSYTTFAYRKVEAPSAPGVLTVAITNTGQRDGEEVAQLYLRRTATGFVEPERQLVAFERVFIPKDETRTVSFRLPETTGGTLLVGSSSQDIRIVVEGPTTQPGDSAVRGDIVEPTTDAADEEEAGQDGYVWPTDSLVVRKLRDWQDQKFGILLHWGLYSVPGIVESWSICDENWIRRDTTMTYDQYKQWYWGLANDFRPRDFRPGQWAEVAQAAGMRYMLFTTKHHDGFCLFDSRETDFTTVRYDGRDFVRPVLQAFRERGFLTGTYFSKPDWHAPSYWWDVYATKGRNVNYPIAQHPERWEQFKQFTYNQIRELMTDYGRVDILWLDGGWVCPENHQDIDMPAIARMARERQPSLIVVDRTIRGPYENYQTPERSVPDRLLPYPWESCIPLSDDWGWVERPRWKSARQVINTLVEVVAKGGNLVLGVGPTADGLIEPAAEERLRAIGAWLQKNGRAIYATLPLGGEGPLWFTAAKDGSRHYALLALPEGEPLPPTLTWALPEQATAAPRQRRAKAPSLRLVATGQRLQATIREGRVSVALPPGLPSEPLAIEIEGLPCPTVVRQAEPY